jgi:hypothetical protein
MTGLHRTIAAIGASNSPRLFRHLLIEWKKNDAPCYQQHKAIGVTVAAVRSTLGGLIKNVNENREQLFAWENMGNC